MAWLGAVYWAYRVVKVEIFMLSMGCFSFSIVVINVLIKIIPWRHFEIGAIFFVGAVFIGLGKVSASWLKSLQKEGRHAE